MSHDLYAAWATQEVARILKSIPSNLFAIPVTGNLDVYANRESGRVWPIPDGRITAENVNQTYEVAVELKRVNEGLHGVLTAIGQSQAYIHKGYSGTSIIIPNSYDTHSSPGQYVTDVLNRVHPNLSVGVFSYADPDLTLATPFLGKITVHRPIQVNANQAIMAGNFLRSEQSKTQWAHLREGSSDVDAFFKYLQIAKQLDLGAPLEPVVNLPPALAQIVSALPAGQSPLNYLSCANGGSFHDIVWRNFWFKYILTPQVAEIWNRNGAMYNPNLAKSLVKINQSTLKQFFSGRSDSIKESLVSELNSGAIAESEAWKRFAENVHDRAHSYREDIDSGLSHLGLLTSDGKPTELGYKFVDAAERTGDCHSGKPWMIFGAAILKNGNLAAFLHYIFKVSELEFQSAPMKFINEIARPGHPLRWKFDQNSYLDFLRDELADNLHVMNTAVLRGGTPRKAFQGEFAILRKFDFINKFRIGVGLEINWPAIQEFMNFQI